MKTDSARLKSDKTILSCNRFFQLLNFGSNAVFNNDPAYDISLMPAAHWRVFDYFLFPAGKGSPAAMIAEIRFFLAASAIRTPSKKTMMTV